MVEAARRRLSRATIEVGDLNTYEPGRPVAATTVFRAIYYARDRAAFFARVAGFTEKKLVFDLNPRQYRLDDVLAELGAAGFPRVELRPLLRPADATAPPHRRSVAQNAGALGPLARLASACGSPAVVAALR